jgi:hypothetical protein
MPYVICSYHIIAISLIFICIYIALHCIILVLQLIGVFVFIMFDVFYSPTNQSINCQLPHQIIACHSSYYLYYLLSYHCIIILLSYISFTIPCLSITMYIYSQLGSFIRSLFINLTLFYFLSSPSLPYDQPHVYVCIM